MKSIPLIVAGLLPAATWAQTPPASAPAPVLTFTPAPAPQRVTLKECYQVVRNASVRLYYDASYVLTPVACAQIRRNTRITAQGGFDGDVRDYWIDQACRRCACATPPASPMAWWSSFIPAGRPPCAASLRRASPPATGTTGTPMAGPGRCCAFRPPAAAS